MTKFDHEAVKAANRARNAAILDEHDDNLHHGPAGAMAAALHVIARQMRERGQALVDAKKKGAIGTNKTLGVAAAELEQVAESLREDGIEEVRAAAQIAGVAVSLAKDGTGDTERAHEFVYDVDGMPIPGAEPCGDTLDWESPEGRTYGSAYCNLAAGHGGDVHLYRDAHGLIPWPIASPVEQVEVPLPECGAVPQYGPPSADRCILHEGHDGNHEGKWSRWPNTEAGTLPVGSWDEGIADQADREGRSVQEIDNAWSGEILPPDPVEGYGDEPVTVYMNSGAVLAPPAPGALVIHAVYDPSGMAASFDIMAPDVEPVIEPQPYVLDEATARPRRAYRSVSQVETYTDECGLLYRLKYRDKIDGTEVPAWWNVGGTTFHRCAQIIAERWPDLAGWEADSRRDELVSRFDELWAREFADEIAKVQLANPEHPMKTWRAAAKGTEERTWWRENGPEMVVKYYAWHCSRLRQGWAVRGCEIEFSHDVGGVEVQGFIDRVDVRGDGIEVIDYKAGATKPKTFQLGVYADVVGATSAGHYHARKGEFEPTSQPVRQLHPREEIVYRVTSMDAAERAGVYLANTSRGYGGCGSCSMKRHCPIGSRR